MLKWAVRAGTLRPKHDASPNDLLWFGRRVQAPLAARSTVAVISAVPVRPPPHTRFGAARTEPESSGTMLANPCDRAIVASPPSIFHSTGMLLSGVPSLSTTCVTDPLSLATTYVYDAAGRVTSRTDAKSQVTNYSYDVVDRLTGIDYPTGTTDVSFTYDALGNRLTMVDGTGTPANVLDALYRPTSITDGASNAVNYTYDSAGRMTAIIYPGGTSSVAYGYDNANRLTSVTDWQSKVTSYTYDNANRLTSTTLGNKLISDRTYDNADRLLTLVNRNGGTTISSYTYTLDSVGNRTQTVVLQVRARTPTTTSTG